MNINSDIKKGTLLSLLEGFEMSLPDIFPNIEDIAYEIKLIEGTDRVDKLIFASEEVPIDTIETSFLSYCSGWKDCFEFGIKSLK